MMRPEDHFGSWKRRRTAGAVPTGFADRVMSSLPQHAVRRQVGWQPFFAAVLDSRVGKLGICALGCCACALRILSMAELFLPR